MVDGAPIPALKFSVVTKPTRATTSLTYKLHLICYKLHLICYKLHLIFYKLYLIFYKLHLIWYKLFIKPKLHQPSDQNYIRPKNA